MQHLFQILLAVVSYNNEELFYACGLTNVGPLVKKLFNLLLIINYNSTQHLIQILLAVVRYNNGELLNACHFTNVGPSLQKLFPFVLVKY